MPADRLKCERGGPETPADASLQRVRCAIGRGMPDKVPFHAYESPELVMRMAGRPVHAMYLDTGAYFDAMIRAQYVFHNDIVSMRPDPYLIYEMLTHSYESDRHSLDDLQFVPSDDGLLIHLKRGGELLGRVPADSKTVIPIKPPPPLIRTHADVEKIRIVPCEELLQRPRWAGLKRYTAEFKGKRFLYTGVGAASANLLDMYLGTAEAMTASIVLKIRNTIPLARLRERSRG